MEGMLKEPYNLFGTLVSRIIDLGPLHVIIFKKGNDPSILMISHVDMSSDKEPIKYEITISFESLLTINHQIIFNAIKGPLHL